MRLRSAWAQEVSLPRLDVDIRFERGEELWTEIIAKFTPDQVADELRSGGFATETTFTNDQGRYLFHPGPAPSVIVAGTSRR